MKILVDIAACVGHARCQHVAPVLFVLDPDGYNTRAAVIDVPPGQEALARRALRACPERVLTLQDDVAAEQDDAAS